MTYASTPQATSVPGVHVVGYFAGVMGTGEQGRQVVGALRTQGIPITMTTLHPHTGPEDDELASSSAQGGAAAAPSVALLCVNADSVPSVASQLDREVLAGRYVIGYWAWEVSSFPERFMAAFDHLDEVWVGSNHARDAIAAIASVPVLRIPEPVSLPVDCALAPAPEGLPGGFRFVFAFDYLSVFERKNPLGVARAFARAFAPGAGAVLILKTLNHDYNPAAHERLREAAAAHSDIHLIERRMSRMERDGLMNAADCYVSLHRAEGFGYTLAEAMWLGKPVIATRYSANLDYMTDTNSYLVKHRLVPIGSGNEPYPPDGLWADPDIDHAAALMREVFERRDEARRRGERAARDIRERHAAEVAGRVMAGRLRIVSRAARSQSRLRRARAHTARLTELIESSPRPPAPRRLGGLRRAAHRGVLSLMKPVTAHQRLLDRDLLAALQELRSNIESLSASRRDSTREGDH